MTAEVKKVLVAFDFDHTIIDDNSDLYVRKLAPNGELPPEIKALYKDDGWTEYMGAIFKYLHSCGVTETQIHDCMKELKFVAGMKELLAYLASDMFEVIIISDANSDFISCILDYAGIGVGAGVGLVRQVYTNPARFDSSGCLQISMYHEQDWCDLSTRNLCKGHILDEHVSARARDGVTFPLVVYVGDGSNDLCPALRLRHTDLVFPRRGYKLATIIGKHDVKARVVPWTHAAEIMDIIKAEAAKISDKSSISDS